jgi:hypothetical protein
MNKLTLDIGRTDENELTLLLYIDGTEFRRIILDNSNAAFFPSLADSQRSSGDYLILTCECGVADCGGWDKVHVLHSDNAILWTFSFNDKEFNFAFDKNSYVDEIQKMQARITRDDLILQPQFAADPE